MMEGTHVYTGRVVEVRRGTGGIVGRVSVRGARLEIALDLVPQVKAGDDVLVHAGVALSVVQEPATTGDAGERGS
jgi:hydrogenase maturation factor